jgi:hypothetical protein
MQTYAEHWKEKASLLPVSGYGSGRKKYQFNNPDKWKLFARRLSMNSFVKKYLAERQESKCPWCALQMDDRRATVVHHLTYDHLCEFGKTAIIKPGATNRRQKDPFEIPKCHDCLLERPDLFSQCMERVRLVHDGCHREIHEHSRLLAQTRV